MRKAIFGVNANSNDPDQPEEKMYSLIRSFVISFIMFYCIQSFYKRTLKVLDLRL